MTAWPSFAPYAGAPGGAPNFAGQVDHPPVFENPEQSERVTFRLQSCMSGQDGLPPDGSHHRLNVEK